eukprot:GFUD01019442.1.p1 GENE.GFUD01019442.1~~GFUD01019442.1.p1  ORF type:complete len:354 (+),score=36.12 GFUD01019442.1:92-1063(+)
MDEPNYITEDSFNEDIGEMDESGNTHSIDDSAQKSVSDKISCKICDKTFSSMNNLKRHLSKRSCEGTQEKNNLHDNYRKYHCKLCSNKFKFEHTLALHCKKSHNVGYLKDCSFCNIRFEISESVQDLYYHTKNVHESENHSDEYQEIEKEYTMSKIFCQICGKTFKTRGNWYIHMATKHDSPEYKTCHICGKTLKTSLRSHLRTHVDEVAICSLCGTSLKNKMYLTAHMRTHNTIPFPCETCGKEFVTKSSLQEHINGVHLKKRNFKCEHCEKSFATSWKVKSHIMSIHTKEKPFVCEKCDYKCSRIDSLRSHINTIHGQKKI